MDNYPHDLAPEFEESGAVKTPFDEWWSRVSQSFPNVPENVARYWLHEHWKHSPFAYLRSANYRFTRMEWPDLRDIRSSWDDFKPEHEHSLAKGKELVTSKILGSIYPTAAYMLVHRQFPAPTVVLDNCDGHHNSDYRDEESLPRAFILIEGHTRFNIGIYLQRIGNMDAGDVWLMNKAER